MEVRLLATILVSFETYHCIESTSSGIFSHIYVLLTLAPNLVEHSPADGLGFNMNLDVTGSFGRATIHFVLKNS